MATTTISPRVVLQDDTGTFVDPNDDGTPINNALFQTLQDRIDALFTGTLTLNMLRVEGPGGHLITSGAPGGTTLLVQNPVAAPGNFAGFGIYNDLGQRAFFYQTSSSTSPVGDLTRLDGAGDGGLEIVATGVRGITLHTANPPITLESSSLSLKLDGSTTSLLGLEYSGTLNVAGGTPVGVRLAPTCITAAGHAVGMEIAPTLGPSTSGGQAVGLIVTTPILLGGTATSAATMRIIGAPTGGAVGMVAYALQILAGNSLLGDRVYVGPGTAVEPGYSFSGGGLNAGMYLQPSIGDYGGQLGLATAGCPVFTARFQTGGTIIQVGVNEAEAPGSSTRLITFKANEIIRFDHSGSAFGNVEFTQPGIYMANIPVVTGANPIHLHTTGALIKTSSSARYKRAIRDLDLDDPLAIMGKLRPRLYQDAKPLDDAGRRDYVGLIAEEVEAVEPALVGYDAAGTAETVLYDRVPVYLLLALRQLTARLDALEGRAP